MVSAGVFIRRSMKGAVSIPINVSAIPPAAAMAYALWRPAFAVFSFPRACELRDGHGSTRGEPGEEAYHKGNDLGGRTAYARKRFFSHKLSHDHTVDRIIKLLKKSSEQDREEEQEKLLPDDAFCNLVFLSAVWFP